MKYNIGDKIVIKPKEWFEKNKELILSDWNIRASAKYFLHLLESCFGKEATITDKDIAQNGYRIDIDEGRFVWTEDFFIEN